MHDQPVKQNAQFSQKTWLPANPAFNTARNPSSLGRVHFLLGF